jgi:hypothetical protein
MAGHAAGLERLEITMQPPQHGHGWVGLRYAGSASRSLIQWPMTAILPPRGVDHGQATKADDLRE